MASRTLPARLAPLVQASPLPTNELCLDLPRPHFILNANQRTAAASVLLAQTILAEPLRQLGFRHTFPSRAEVMPWGLHALRNTSSASISRESLQTYAHRFLGESFSLDTAQRILSTCIEGCAEEMPALQALSAALTAHASGGASSSSSAAAGDARTPGSWYQLIANAKHEAVDYVLGVAARDAEQAEDESEPGAKRSRHSAATAEAATTAHSYRRFDAEASSQAYTELAVLVCDEHCLGLGRQRTDSCMSC